MRVVLEQVLIGGCVAWMLCGVGGCSKDEAAVQARAEPSASPQPSSGTAVRRAGPVSTERASPPKPGLDFQLFRGAKGRAFGLKDAALVCEEPCSFPAKGTQRLWLVRDGEARAANQYWPSRAWEGYSGPMRERGMATYVAFQGSYPGRVFAYGSAETRSGEGNLPPVNFVSGKWERYHLELPTFHLDLPPREYDEALLSAPVDFNPLLSFAFGGGAPTMMTEQGAVLLYDGKTWTTKPAPWNSAVELARLADGNTLAISQRAWLISPDGRVAELELENNHAEYVVNMGGEAWLVGYSQLSKPRAAGRFKLAALPKRAPTARASPGRASSQPGPLANPKQFGPTCKAPAVVLQRRDGSLLHPEQLPTLFAKDPAAGAGLEAYLATFELGERYVVQAQDETAARRVLGLLRSRPELQGKLECVDLRSKLRNPYTRLDQLRRVFIHARSGVALDLT